jgi:hypothetical protein
MEMNNNHIYDLRFTIYATILNAVAQIQSERSLVAQVGSLLCRRLAVGVCGHFTGCQFAKPQPANLCHMEGERKAPNPPNRARKS